MASTLGNTSGNPGGANKQNSSKNNNNRGSGSSLGTSKEDSEGESTTIISDKSIFMTRKGIDSETVQIRITANRDIQGDLRIGISLDKYGQKIEALPESATISCGENNQIIGSTIKGLALKDSESINLLVKLKNHSNFALGVY